MINALKRSSHKFLLIGKINGLSHEAKRARLRLRKTIKDGQIYSLTSRKLALGVDVRHHLLAYAFLRGASYHSVEATCHYAPNKELIFKIAKAHAPLYIAYDTFTGAGGGSYSIKEENIDKWLNGEDN